MAKASIQMPEDFLQAVSALADHTDEIMPRVLEAGGKIVLARVRGNLRGVIGKRIKYKARSIGELEAALGLSPAKLDKDGNFNVKIGFSEPRRQRDAGLNVAHGAGRGVTNAMLANIIEHGKHGQPAKPFLKPAKTASKAACIAAMQEKLREEIDRI